MKQIGPKGLTTRAVDRLIRQVPGSTKIGEYRWPLDVGERTVSELSALAPWLHKNTIQGRLDRGERKLDALIRAPRQGNSSKARAALSRVFKAEAKQRKVAYERRCYLKRQAAGHKEL